MREVLEQLKQLTNVERLAVIETATKLVREDLAKNVQEARAEMDSRLQAAAMAVRDLYEPGGELTEWTDLDAEDFVDEHVQG